MANELTWDTVTGLTINAYRFKTDDNVFLANPASNEVWGTDGRDASDYAIVLTESGSSGHYSVDFNDGGAIAAGVYRIVFALQATGVPLDSDRKVAKGEIDWDGTAEITKSVIDTVVDTIAGDVVNIDGIVPAAAGDLTTAQNDLDTITGGSGVLIDTDAVDADAIKADAVTEIQSGLATSTNVTDAHTATDAGISTVDGKVNTIAIDVAGLDGEVMRGTDSAITSLDPITTDKDSYKATGFNTVVPDAAGVAAALHGTTDGKIDALNNITVADILAGVVEGSITLVQIQRLILSVLAGLASGGDTTSIKFRDLADTKNRVTETVDANGNRTSVTLDLT